MPASQQDDIVEEDATELKFPKGTRIFPLFFADKDFFLLFLFIFYYLMALLIILNLSKWSNKLILLNLSPIFTEFENADTLLVSEVFLLLDHRREQTEHKVYFKFSLFLSF